MNILFCGGYTSLHFGVLRSFLDFLAGFFYHFNMPVSKEIHKMSIARLECEVKRHNHLYFVEHKPEISDYEFDLLVEELRKRRPDSKVLAEIGNDITGVFKKIKHAIPMLSLDKAYDLKTMESWAEKFEGKIIISPKIDGCAMSLKYGADGGLFQAATRGSGTVGEDVMPNVHFVKDIPQKINLKNVEVRGEIYMPLSVFERYKDKFANPRNLAAGAIKQKDPKKTGEYTLSFWAYDLIGSSAKDEAAKRKLLEGNNFPVIEWTLIDKTEIQKVFDEYFKRRNKFDYEMDGVVYKANDCAEQERLGVTAHHPRYGIAYKFQGDAGTTILKDVEWSVARTGVITPVGIVEPVELSGAMVSRVSLHNYGLMKKLCLTRGAKVLMMRRGGVIPNLEAIVLKGKGEFKVPAKCPSCGSNVETRDDFLYCTRPKECVRAKIGELKHFVQTVEIDNFGDVLLEKLYEEGLVTDPSEFYELKIGDLIPMERMGETLAEKLVRNVQSRRELPLDVFLRSLGIREFGKHVSQILASEYGTLERVLKVTKEELSNIHTIGEVIADEVVNGLKLKRPLIDRLLKYVKVQKGEAKKTGHLEGRSFLFTGAMIVMPRDEAQKLVEEKGGVAAAGVSKNLDYLVVGDGGGAGSKLTKAKKLIAEGAGVKIIGEKEFLKMVG